MIAKRLRVIQRFLESYKKVYQFFRLLGLPMTEYNLDLRGGERENRAMLNLFDTQTRSLVPLHPIDGKSFRFYCCGPTVYGPAHIGNFRTFVMQDVFRRTMELNDTETIHIRNLTDVDDKTIRDSQKAGMSLGDFTASWTKKFHQDCEALHCLPPHIEPSAVAHIQEQIDMVKTLIDGGHAYPAGDGSVYFRIASFPKYGELSHLDSRELDLGKTAQTRSQADEYEKDSVADFVLWKGRKPEDGENFWVSPWGEGRPGWHLECSAMIHRYFGNSFDLHSGGVDLVFPHHENEVAQSKCACGGDFAKHWFHITHLLVDGGKMSKSLGNMFTLGDLEALGHSAAALRYVLAGAYYRRPLNFTLDSMADAKIALGRLARAEEQLAQRAGEIAKPSFHDLCAQRPELGEFLPAWESLQDDLNTPEALGHVFSALKRLKIAELSPVEAKCQWLGFWVILSALGLELPNLQEKHVIPDDIASLAEVRWKARLAKDWAQADVLRKELAEKGWVMKDGKDGYELTPQ